MYLWVIESLFFSIFDPRVILHRLIFNDSAIDLCGILSSSISRRVHLLFNCSSSFSVRISSMNFVISCLSVMFVKTFINFLFIVLILNLFGYLKKKIYNLYRYYIILLN